MRFKFKWLIIKKLSLCGHGGIGRRARFRFWWVSRAGSSPVARTRLSLDAIRVPGSAFSFAFSLALAAGSDLVTSTGGELPLPNRELHLCGVRGFSCPRFPLAAILPPESQLSLDAFRVLGSAFSFCPAVSLDVFASISAVSL